MATQIAMPQAQAAMEQQPKTPEMNDRDRLADLLALEKYMVTGYNIGLNEAQRPGFIQTLFTVLNETHQTQKQIFELMFQKGWYTMKAAEQQEVVQLKTQFSGYASQIPSWH